MTGIENCDVLNGVMAVIEIANGKLQRKMLITQLPLENVPSRLNIHKVPSLKNI